MSSAIDYIKCEHCGGINITEFDCHTFEEYAFCKRCGMVDNKVIARDENGNAITDKSSQIQYKTETLEGFGCIGLYSKTGFGLLSPLEKPFEESEKEYFLGELNNPDIEPEKCYFTRWDSDTNQVVSVYGEIPPLYDDEMKET